MFFFFPPIIRLLSNYPITFLNISLSMLQLIISHWKHWFPCYFFNVDADSYHRVSTSLSVALESFTLRKKRKITKSPLSYLCSDVSSLKEYSADYLISNCYPNIMHIKYLVCVSVCVCVWLFSHARLFETQLTVACQALLVHRIILERILKWVAIYSSRGIFFAQGSNLNLLHWSGFFTPESPREPIL